METMKIGTVEYSLLITHTELGFVYTLSYVDSDCKKHAITFSDLRYYTDYICMLMERSYAKWTHPYVMEDHHQAHAWPIPQKLIEN